MKNSEIKQLSVEELTEQIEEQTAGLRKLKFSHAVSPIENPMLIRVKRRLVARMKTELTNRVSAETEA